MLRMALKLTGASHCIPDYTSMSMLHAHLAYGCQTRAMTNRGHKKFKFQNFFSPYLLQIHQNNFSMKSMCHKVVLTSIYKGPPIVIGDFLSKSPLKVHGMSVWYPSIQALLRVTSLIKSFIHGRINRFFTF